MKQTKFINSFIFIALLYVFISCSENTVREINTVPTIDSTLQKYITGELTGVITENSGDWGCVVVMDVNTGEIKAMVNLRKDTTTNSCDDNYNFAAYKMIEPGHIFSLASVMAGIEDDLISLEDTVSTGEGSVVFYDLTIRDSNIGGYGNISLKKVFGVSS
ncbi:MAG: penicillin-binding transpeptidase domain-containing protein, partial [Bacteroidota bacterium]